MNLNSAVNGSLSDLLAHLGVSADRVRATPPPGTARVEDCVAANEADDSLYELVDGILVEKATGYEASIVAGAILSILRTFVFERQLGFVSGADGFFRLPSSTRGPDVAFVSLDRFDQQKVPTAYPELAPNLAVEVLSPGNTASEMSRKRLEYFTAGVQLVWIVDCVHRTVAVYQSSTEVIVLAEDDKIDGGKALPGFEVTVSDFFADLDLAMQIRQP